MLTSEGNSQGTTTCQKHTIRVGPNFSAEPTDPTQILNRGPSLPEFGKKIKKKNKKMKTFGQELVWKMELKTKHAENAKQQSYTTIREANVVLRYTIG